MKLLTWTKNASGGWFAVLPYEIDGSIAINLTKDHDGGWTCRLNNSNRAIGDIYAQSPEKAKASAIIWLIERIEADQSWSEKAANIWDHIIGQLVADVERSDIPPICGCNHKP